MKQRGKEATKAILQVLPKEHPTVGRTVSRQEDTVLLSPKDEVFNGEKGTV